MVLCMYNDVAIISMRGLVGRRRGLGGRRGLVGRRRGLGERRGLGGRRRQGKRGD